MRFAISRLLAVFACAAATVGEISFASVPSLTCAPDAGKEEPNQAPKKMSIAWRMDLAAARREAREKERPLLLVIAFPSCKWWLRMERTTFTDPRVRELVAGMVPVLLHGDEDGKLFEEFNVTECPLIALFDSSGKELARVQGLQDSATFIPWLKRTAK